MAHKLWVLSGISRHPWVLFAEQADTGYREILNILTSLIGQPLVLSVLLPYGAVNPTTIHAPLYTLLSLVVLLA